ncbi:MAG: alpha/beta hydrolase [Chloroflexi bacterium]|nr:alpha/beta hydrolase [Chloroflexota bacterium]
MDRTAQRSQQTEAARRPGVLRRLGVGLLVFAAALLALISTLPVWLLFVWTATPVLVAAGLAALDIGIFYWMLRFARGPLPVLGGLVALVAVSALAVFVSQATASTPAPRQPGGIATLEQVELGGTPQWITVRGSSLDNPVLLFLSGGPGGSELAWTRQYLGGLEDHFIVVNWDQPGTGKSYGAFDISSLTPERYVSDAYELTQILRERFGQDKIYVLGESWGTILGTWLVQRHPELFHAYIASAQMVYTVRDDVMGYEFAIDYAEQDGNTALVEDLRRTGPPPYADFWTYAGYLNVLNSYMYAHADGEGGGDNRLFDVLTAPEYGLLDKVNWVLGLEQVFEQVYPLLGEIDFPATVTALEVPVYFLEGRWDVNAFASLVEEYYAVLEAPHKELIWFENSGHTPLYEEPNRFVDVLVNTVLAQTQPE